MPPCTLKGLAKNYHFSLDTPVGELPEEIMDIILYGTKGEKIKLRRESEYGSGSYTAPFEGVINNLERRFRETLPPGSRRRSRPI